MRITTSLRFGWWAVSDVMTSLSVVIVFLAVVTSKDHWGYLEALAIEMLNDFLIVPMCVAALLTLMVWLWMKLQRAAATFTPSRRKSTHLTSIAP